MQLSVFFCCFHILLEPDTYLTQWRIANIEWHTEIKAYYANQFLLKSRLVCKKSKPKLYWSVIRPTVTYICEAPWVLKGTVKYKLMVFAREVLRKILGVCRSRRIFQGEKIPSTSSFGEEVKPAVPCRIFTTCKRSLNVTWKSAFRQNYRILFSLIKFHISLLGSIASRRTWRLLAATVGTSKTRGNRVVQQA
jgi:hypothetical protein